MNILAYQLAAPLARGPHTSLHGWTDVLSTSPFTGHVERALWAGFHADRIAYAFVGGYAAALGRLVAGKSPRPFPARLSLCATEAGGAHPRNIATRLDTQGDALLLNGEKTFVTLGIEADELLVVASRGMQDGPTPSGIAKRVTPSGIAKRVTPSGIAKRVTPSGIAKRVNRLCVLRVKPRAKGVELIAKPPLPFAPELPHAVARFTDVVVDDEDLLPGDGYDDYLKPFRTIEDTHVLAATVGYLTAAGRAHGFDPGILLELVNTSLSLVDIGGRDPSAPLTHLLLAGSFGAVRRLVAALGPDWERAPEEERARWHRDQAILMVADGVRALRTAAAWKAMSSTC